MVTDILIIGAGVNGIALANHLHDQNLSFIVVGKYMDLWRNHTFQNMKLRSDFTTSEIAHPRKRFSTDNFLKQNPEFFIYRNRHLPVDIFRNYLSWVEANLEFSVLDDMVIKLSKKSTQAFHATLERGGDIKAKYCVIASGLSDHRYIPSPFSVNSDHVVHSYQTGIIEEINHKRILVVGAGQSAAESIDILKKNNNHVTWYRKHLPLYLEQPVNIPLWLFSVIAKSGFLFRCIPLFLRKNIINILSRPTIMPEFKSLLEKTNLLRSDISLAEIIKDKSTFDMMIAATGFQYNLANLPFLPESLKSEIQNRQGIPVLDRKFQTSIPGLYFVGGISESYFGPAVKFIVGSHYASKVILKSIYGKIGRLSRGVS